MNDATHAFLRLEVMVRDGIRSAETPKPPRTEAEEDHMAMEDIILQTEGVEALENYHRRRACSRPVMQATSTTGCNQ